MQVSLTTRPYTDNMDGQVTANDVDRGTDVYVIDSCWQTSKRHSCLMFVGLHKTIDLGFWQHKIYDGKSLRYFATFCLFEMEYSYVNLYLLCYCISGCYWHDCDCVLQPVCQVFQTYDSNDALTAYSSRCVERKYCVDDQWLRSTRTSVKQNCQTVTCRSSE